MERSLLWAAALLACLSLGGCFWEVRMPAFPNQVKVSVAKGLKVVFYGRDRKVVPHVLVASQKALRRVQMWGPLSHEVTVRIFPTHRSLEEAVMRRYTWLRAWALFGQIYLQSPRTWRIRRFHPALSELLVHELTHVAMFQLCCTKRNWRSKRIPFWFREGMASVTARQGRRRWSMERLGLFARTPKGQRVVSCPSHYLKRHQPQAYSLAHWKFALVVRKWGNKGVKTLLARMRAGRSFEAAFRSISGHDQRAFQRSFEKLLRSKIVVSRFPKTGAGPLQPVGDIATPLGSFWAR